MKTSIASKFLRLAILAGLGLPLSAITVNLFPPPNDPVGGVGSSGNDFWIAGRGVVFQALANMSIDSVGVYQNLTNQFLQFEVFQVTGVTGNVFAGQVLLRNGSRVVTTSGLEFIDFAIAPLALAGGSFYEIEFLFNGPSNANYYYVNNNLPFTVSNFGSLDGTMGEDTSNLALPAIRVNLGSAAPGVPEPSTWMLTGAGVVLVLRRAVANSKTIRRKL
jgi:hypothetical protein